MYVNRMIIIQITINSFAIVELGNDIQKHKVCRNIVHSYFNDDDEDIEENGFFLDTIPD